ncbi:MAG: DUF1232 domain-containing protein [Tannerella sp.]|jgi:uncharacterized membrane protein YkvA (DUF1232 family)|nr:DUF1232 domain-containing protein [Tannerella sp.]
MGRLSENRLPARRLEETGDYGDCYDGESLLRKLKSVAGLAGETVLRPVLTLYHIMRDGGVSALDKAQIIGALGYFIFPADAIPDFIALVGYTDDVAVMLLLLRQMAGHVTPEIGARVEAQIAALLGRGQGG